MPDYKIFSEKNSCQEPVIELLKSMGYNYASSRDVAEQRDNSKKVILKKDLNEFLQRQRFEYGGQKLAFSQANINKAIDDIDVSLSSGLMKASQEIYDMLLYGKSYDEILPDGCKSSFDLHYVDWENIENNIFRVVDEFVVYSENTKDNRRPDVVVFVNGLPWVVIECKSSVIDIKMAVNQNVENFSVIPQLFKFAQIVLAVGPNDVRYATAGSGREYFVAWREKFKNWLDEKCEKYACGRSVREQDKVLISLLSKERLFLLVKNYVVYDYGIKKVARYQQFFACEKTIKKIKDERKGGVVWHTQGSGKSLTMVMLVKRIIGESIKENCFFKNPRFVMVCDRIELDKQLEGNFAKTGMHPSRATSGNGLVKLIKDEGKVLITTVIHKFETAQAKLSPINNKNIFLFIDECHRTQSGSFHNYMKSILPNAVKLGFTGTPIFKSKKETTYQIFGGPIDSYTILEAEKDGVIVPLNYEGRIIPQKVVDDEVINKCFEAICFNVLDEEKEKLKGKWSSFTKISQVDSRLQIIAFAIAQHFRHVSQNGFKAIATESSRVNAIKLHNFLKANGLRSKVVISANTNRAEGDEELNESDSKYIENFFKQEVETNFGKNYEMYEDNVRNNFKSFDGDVDIIVVKDKLLTGFDAPIASVLYIDKPLRDHNLLQAIARVNRVYPGKDCGHIVDFYGVLGKLKSAVEIYSDPESGLGKFDAKDLKGTLFARDDIIFELENSYKTLVSMFDGLNFKDLECLENSLQDSDEDKKIGKMSDRRKEFYDKVKKFSTAFKNVANNYEVYTFIGKEKIDEYKKELLKYQKLKESVKIRFGDDSKIDFSMEEQQLKNLLNSYVGAGMDKIIISKLKITDKKAMEEQLSKMSGNRSKADAIASHLDAVFREEYFKNPLMYKNFNDRIKKTIQEYEEYRNDETYLLSIEKIAEDYREGFVGNDYPSNIENDSNSKSFYGCLKIYLDEKIDIKQNNEVDLKLGEISIKIKNLYKEKIKPYWENNLVIIDDINREIDKYLFDIEDSFGIELDTDEMDSIEENIFKTAAKRYYDKLI